MRFPVEEITESEYTTILLSTILLPENHEFVKIVQTSTVDPHKFLILPDTLYGITASRCTSSEPALHIRLMVKVQELRNFFWGLGEPILEVGTSETIISDIYCACVTWC